MAINLLAISTGNTRTRIGTFVDDGLEPSHTILNRDLDKLTDQIRKSYRLIADKESPLVLVASTCSPVTQSLADTITDLGPTVAQVEKDIAVPIGRQLDPEAIVGDDRLLNAAAAYDTLRQACVVVDAGTAITIDFIDCTGTFHGGGIAPGAAMMLNALAQHAHQLPEIDLIPPAEPIGHNTVEAVRSGIFYGLRGMVRELTEHYAETAGSYPPVVATGGDAEMLFTEYDLVEHIVPDLTLMGMLLTIAGPKEAKDE